MQMRKARASSPHPRLPSLISNERVEIHGSKSDKVLIRHLTDEGVKHLTASLQREICVDFPKATLQVTSLKSDGGVYISASSEIATSILWWAVFDVVKGWGATISIVH